MAPPADSTVAAKPLAGASSRADRKSPWLQNKGNFNDKFFIDDSDLILLKHNINLVNDCLCFDESDYTPLERGWGYCLLGFFAGKFPGR